MRSIIITVVLTFLMTALMSAMELSNEEINQGFVSLFDSKSLAGWQGNSKYWVAEAGQLVYKALTQPEHSADLLALKLMSRRQYSDFLLRFEFKLQPGANNGVAIRAPLKGDPAFVGMEIQIIDTDGWPNKLKPFQVHGSIYGVVPAKTGHLKPAGQWNEEEILCDGRHVKVTLNGAIIVDANLDEASPIDGQKHSGLRSNSGYIGFLGHTKSVAFRNIKIKELNKKMTSMENDYFPPPESEGGWRMLDKPDQIRRIAGMDSDKLSDLKDWLMVSDKHNFAAAVIRRGYIVLQVERGNSAETDSRRVASVSKAICATVLAIASEQSQHGKTPHKMTFDDPAFDFIPWAKPLSDPRKAKIMVKQLLNHTSGICPEATGARNDGTWQYILGLSGDERTAKLAFDPGKGCGYSTIALAHASLVCEYVTGKPYDEFAVEALFKPIGCEHWWFQYYDGGKEIGRHPSHGMGMPARDLARIAYCMLRGGRWNDKQVIPKWFVEQTAIPSHNVTTPEMRWGYNPKIFSLGWELPANLTGQNNEGVSGKGIPRDARYKPGSGGQLIAFVPSLDLVVTRQTGSSGNWQFTEYLRRACAAVLE